MGRLLSILWIALTIIVNVIALAKLLQGLGLTHEVWHGPLVVLGRLYDAYAVKAFAAVSNWTSSQFGFSLPQWSLHAFVLYVSTASAFVVGGTGLMHRDTSGRAFFGALISAAWLLALPAFVFDAIRYRVVTHFARQNTMLFFLYVFAFSGIYLGARYINDHYFASARAASSSSRISFDAGQLAASKLLGRCENCAPGVRRVLTHSSGHRQSTT